MKRTLRAAAGVFAAGLSVAAVSGVAAVAQTAEQTADQIASLSAPLQNQATPDPAIAEGLAVFNRYGAEMGTLEKVVHRDGRQYAVLLLDPSRGGSNRWITVPYRKLSVVNGLIKYEAQ